MAISIVLADDHRIILDGLAQLFSRESDFRVVATCTSGEDAVIAVQEHRPDVLVLDFQMPRGDGLWVLKTLRGKNTVTRSVLLTAMMDEDDTIQAIELGVAGVVLKEAASVNLVSCVRRVMHGERVLDPVMMTRALDRMLHRQDGERPTEMLSPRETEIVKMVATGLRNKDIADKLDIGAGTVKTHLHAIYEKLGLRGRVELTMYAYERGMV
jgi:two-component system nitrate/nitrite response regulator NarL